MMQNFCRICGCEVLMRDHVGKWQDREIICIYCIEEMAMEATLRSAEGRLEIEINRQI